jgi:hypothetical protein
MKLFEIQKHNTVTCAYELTGINSPKNLIIYLRNRFENTEYSTHHQQYDIDYIIDSQTYTKSNLKIDSLEVALNQLNNASNISICTTLHLKEKLLFLGFSLEESMAVIKYSVTDKIDFNRYKIMETNMSLI